MSYPLTPIEIGCDFISGYGFSSKDFTDNKSDIPVIKIKNIQNEYVTIQDSQFFPPQKVNDKHQKFFVRNDDVLIAMTGQGSVGRVGMVDLRADEVALLNQRVGKFAVKDGYIDKNYLYFVLISKRYQKILFDKGSGSGQPNLSPDDILGVEIPMPPFEIQKSIGDLLYTLKRKIDLLRRQNHTLEQIAQTLFKRWFVEFEFPFDFASFDDAQDRQGRPNEHGQPYKSSGGPMVTSELGEIPEGWRVIQVEELIEVTDGRHDTPKPTTEGFPLITSKHLNKWTIDFDSAYFISEEDYIRRIEGRTVEKYDILISLIGTVGILYFVMEDENSYSIKNIGLFKSSQMPSISEYLYLYLGSNYGKYYLESRLAGTTQSYLTHASLREISMVLPPEQTIHIFRQKVKPLFSKIHTNINQIQTLTRLRDTLLPKLMSGKLRVKA